MATNALYLETADLVQEMYLRELKAYKTPAMKATDSEGHVQKFSMPQAPKSPEESDLASDLKSYETAQVEVEGQTSEGGAPAVNELQSWFEELDEHIREDPDKGVHH